MAVVALLVAADPASASITTTASFLGAGYKSTPAGGVSSARVKFKVPQITCVDDTRLDALNIGLTSLNSIDERTAYAAIYVACDHSLTPTYFGMVFTKDGGFKQTSIAIGDLMVGMLESNGSTIKVTLQNLTLNTRISSSTSSANDPAVLLGDFGEPTIPTFGRIHFSEAKVNGLPLADDPTPVVRLRLKHDDGLQIGASLISSGATKFTIGFRSNT
jgi:hypothetical protein